MLLLPRINTPVAPNYRGNVHAQKRFHFSSIPYFCLASHCILGTVAFCLWGNGFQVTETLYTKFQEFRAKKIRLTFDLEIFAIFKLRVFASVFEFSLSFWCCALKFMYSAWNFAIFPFQNRKNGPRRCSYSWEPICCVFASMSATDQKTHQKRANSQNASFYSFKNQL